MLLPVHGRRFCFAYTLAIEEYPSVYGHLLKHIRWSFLLAAHMDLNECFYLLFQNILSLNPRINKYATLKPTTRTKQDKYNWKRNQDKNCAVRANKLLFYFFLMLYIPLYLQTLKFIESILSQFNIFTSNKKIFFWPMTIIRLTIIVFIFKIFPPHSTFEFTLPK